jgi:hypothetical protein
MIAKLSHLIALLKFKYALMDCRNTISQAFCSYSYYLDYTVYTVGALLIADCYSKFVSYDMTQCFISAAHY